MPGDTAKPGDKDQDRLELDGPHDVLPTKNSLRDEGKVKLLSGSENDQELSIEAQQKKDQGECPGSEGFQSPVTQNVNDIPLEQEDHPFDAPSAQTDESAMAEEGEPAPVSKAPPKLKPERAQERVGSAARTAYQFLFGLLLHP